jgi:hypothetical protein
MIISGKWEAGSVKAKNLSYESQLPLAASRFPARASSLKKPLHQRQTSQVIRVVVHN